MVKVLDVNLMPMLCNVCNNNGGGVGLERSVSGVADVRVGCKTPPLHQQYPEQHLIKKYFYFIV